MALAPVWGRGSLGTVEEVSGRLMMGYLVRCHRMSSTARGIVVEKGMGMAGENWGKLGKETKKQGSVSLGGGFRK